MLYFKCVLLIFIFFVVKPQISHPSTNMTSVFVKEHHSIALECVTSGHPTPSVNWLKNGNLVTENHYVVSLKFICKKKNT